METNGSVLYGTYEHFSLYFTQYFVFIFVALLSVSLYFSYLPRIQVREKALDSTLTICCLAFQNNFLKYFLRQCGSCTRWNTACPDPRKDFVSSTMNT